MAFAHLLRSRQARHSQASTSDYRLQTLPDVSFLVGFDRTPLDVWNESLFGSFATHTHTRHSYRSTYSDPEDTYLQLLGIPPNVVASKPIRLSTCSSLIGCQREKGFASILQCRIPILGSYRDCTLHVEKQSKPDQNLAMNVKAIRVRG